MCVIGLTHLWRCSEEMTDRTVSVMLSALSAKSWFGVQGLGSGLGFKDGGLGFRV